MSDAGDADVAASIEAALAEALDPRLLAVLDRLAPRARRSLAARLGRTPMPRGSQASGIEIEAHVPYTPGDDLRHVDWNAYGRLDELLLRTYRAERELPWWIFVDVSASMAAPEADGKFAFAAGLSAALAYVATRANDAVRVVALADGLPLHHRAAPRLRHRGRLAELRAFLRGLRPAGGTALASGIEAALGRGAEPGIAVLVSDFLLPPPAVEEALAPLRARRFEVAAIRPLGAGERDPSRLLGRGRIVDAETGGSRVVRLDAANLARYEAALQQHLGHLSAACRRAGAFVAVADPALGLQHHLLREFSRAGLLG